MNELLPHQCRMVDFRLLVPMCLGELLLQVPYVLLVCLLLTPTGDCRGEVRLMLHTSKSGPGAGYTPPYATPSTLKR